jgi:hypothetical protein
MNVVTENSLNPALPDVYGGEIYSASPKQVLEDGVLRAGYSPASHAIDLSLELPGSIKDAQGYLHINSTALKTETVVPVTIAVKDFWIYPFVVVFLGNLLSFAITRWSAAGRAYANQYASIKAAAARFETVVRDRTTLAESDVSDADKLISAALSSKESGDLEASKVSLQKASEKIAFLEQDKAEHPGRPRIRIATPSVNRLFGSNVTFTVAHPDATWTSNTSFQWSFKSAGGNSGDLNSGNDLQYITSRFWQESVYDIEVKVGEKNDVVESCRLDIVPSSSLSGGRGLIRFYDLGILGVSVLIASGLAYLAIARADSFGDVGDYVLAFAGGFGVTEAIKGVGPILSRMQGQNT